MLRYLVASISQQEKIAGEILDRESERHNASAMVIETQDIPYPNPKDYIRADEK